MKAFKALLAALFLVGATAIPASATTTKYQTVQRCAVIPANGQFKGLNNDLTFHVEWYKDSTNGKVHPKRSLIAFKNPERRSLVPPFRKYRTYNQILFTGAAVRVYPRGATYWHTDHLYHLQFSKLSAGSSLNWTDKDLPKLKDVWHNPGRVEFVLTYDQSYTVKDWLGRKKVKTAHLICKNGAWK